MVVQTNARVGLPKDKIGSKRFMKIFPPIKLTGIFGFCLSLIIFSFPAVGKDWALEDASKGWNSRSLVTLYFHNSELQTQWAWSALSKYSFKGVEHILDFGAGDGKVSALMSFMVPKGSVCAVDISKEMVTYASKMFPAAQYKNLTFLPVNHVDFTQIPFSKKFDLVTSFCVFHLVPNPVQVLKNLKLHMQPQGKLVATFPIGGNREFFQAASEAMAQRNWNFPPPTEGTKSIRDPAKTQQMFQEAGFNIEYFQVIETRTSFSTKEEMTDWFEGTLTANWDIPEKGRREFFSDLTDRYLTLRPNDKGEEGFVYFSLKRIEVVASPK